MSPQLVKNSAWIIGGKLVIFSLSFAFITGLANLVPADVAGSYNYVLSLLTIVSLFTLPGMGTALIRAVARGKEGTIYSMMRLRLLWGMMGSVIAVTIGIYYLFQGVPQLGYAFLIAAPFVPLTDTFNELTYYFFQGRKQFNKSTLFAIVVQTSFSLPTLGVLFLTDNLVVIIAVFFACQALAGYAIFKTIRPENNLIDDESIKFGFHLTAMGILRTIANNIDRVIVWHMLGPVTVATYTFAMTPMMKLDQLIPIDALALPELSRTPESPTMKKVIIKKVLLLFTLFIPVVIFGIFITPFVFGILFAKFPQSAQLFQILLATLVLAPIGLMRTSFTAWNKRKSLYIIETISPIVRISAMVTGGLVGGIVGLVCGIAASRTFDAMMIIGLFSMNTSRGHEPLL